MNNPSTTNQPELKLAEDTQLLPDIMAQGLTVSFSVTVTTTKGQRAFAVEGDFDLPLALHPALRSAACEDFETLCTRYLVNTPNTMLGQFIRAITDAERNGQFDWKVGMPAEQKTNPPVPAANPAEAPIDPKNSAPPAATPATAAGTNEVPEAVQSPVTAPQEAIQPQPTVTQTTL
jgi:hypothetical protein